MLVERLGARAVLVGDNFCFGYRQAGNVRVLAQLGRELGFETEIVPVTACRGRMVSSSGIRELIDAAGWRWRRACCERPYALEGDVVSGRGVGSRQTVPTLNLATDAEVLPAPASTHPYARPGERARVGLHHQHRLPAHLRRERRADHRDVPARSAGGLKRPRRIRVEFLGASATSAGSKAPRRCKRRSSKTLAWPGATVRRVGPGCKARRGPAGTRHDCRPVPAEWLLRSC